MQVKFLKDFENLIDTFKCDNDDIDKYFKEKALTDDDAITYCFLTDDLKTVIALSSLSCNGIMATDFGKFYTYPAIEIKMFAVNNEFKGKCIPNGEGLNYSDGCFDLLIEKIYNITERCGASRIFLYSVKRAVNFYKRQGMAEFVELMHGDDRPFLEDCVPMFMHL